MYWISVSALGALWYFFCKGKKKNTPQAEETSGTAASGTTQTASGTKEKASATHTGEPQDLHQGLAALKRVTDPLDRHALYTRLMDTAYKNRNADQQHHNLVIEYGSAYMDEFSTLKPAVFHQLGDSPKVVSIFKQLAIVFEEDQDYERAMDVCRTAMAHGLDDGTKTGYEGRLARLMKKQNARPK